MSRRRKQQPASGMRLPESAEPRRGGGSRPVQVGEAIRQVVGEMITEGAIKDPRVANAMVTITEVEMTPDLRLARIYFSVFPSDGEIIKAAMKGLRSAAGELKRGIASRLGLRFTPDLEFHLDPSVAEGAKIETILREIRDEEPREGE